MLLSIRNKIILIAKLSAAVGLLYWLLGSGQLDLNLLESVKDRPTGFILAQLVFGVVVLLSAWRWQLLLQIQDIHHGFSRLAGLTLIGVFFNQVVPGSTGGDVYRAYAVARLEPHKKSAAVISVVADRVIGLLGMLLTIPVFIVLNCDVVIDNRPLFSLSMMMVAVLVIGVILAALYLSRDVRTSLAVQKIVRRLPFREHLAELDAALAVHREHRKSVVLIVGLSVLLQLSVVLTNLLLATSLFDNPGSWMAYFLLIPIIHFVMSLPVNPPGAIGTAEALYSYVFALVGVSGGAILSILQRVTFIIWSIPGALIYVTHLIFERSRKTETAHNPTELDSPTQVGPASSLAEK